MIRALGADRAARLVDAGTGHGRLREPPDAIFRGLALAHGRLYVDRLPQRPRPHVRLHVAAGHRVAAHSTTPAMHGWYTPFGIAAFGNRVFVTYASPAPPNGNDAPTGGYVDEFDLNGRLVARVGHAKQLDQPWGLALAPRGVRPAGRRPARGQLRQRADQRLRAARAAAGRSAAGFPVRVPGVWGIAFGAGGAGGAPDDPLLRRRAAPLARRDRGRRRRRLRLDRAS